MEEAVSKFFELMGLGVLFLFGMVGVALAVSSMTDSTPKKPRNPRQVANLKILDLLIRYAEQNPDQRFGQILRNTGVVVDVGIADSSQEEWESPDYYWMRGIHEEPQNTLDRMEKAGRGEFVDVKVIKKEKRS